MFDDVSGMMMLQSKSGSYLSWQSRQYWVCDEQMLENSELGNL